MLRSRRRASRDRLEAISWISDLALDLSKAGTLDAGNEFVAQLTMAKTKNDI
jgi:hypothetical protein